MDARHFESLYPKTARDQTIAKILNFVKEGSSVQLLSLPGVGRSTVFRLLAHNRNVREYHLQENENRFHFLLIDLSEIRNRPLFDTTKFIFLSLVDSLKERGLVEDYNSVNTIFKESLSYNDELVLFQGLKSAIDFLTIEKNLSVVFLFDRFEEYVPMVTQQFFTNLRSLRDRAKYRFSAVFALNRSLEDILEPTLITDFYDFIADHYVFLPLSDNDSTTFRLSYVQQARGKTINQNTQAELCQITGGHIRLIRLAAEILLNTSHSGELEQFLLAQKPIQKALTQIWQSLRPSDQKHLLNLLQGKIDQCESSIYLEKLGLLKDNTIQIPLFAAFIKTLPTQTQAEHIVFNPLTNEITKGSQNITETLTASEFRLLRFLLEHKEEVVEREQIINAVWKDSKSTAGVTDQALDQLVLRVRKKIEEDVNKPTHIQTIKGRGFRFTA